jgi:2,3-bisphosphoglycerate-dependent phosphoglycerate mutase
MGRLLLVRHCESTGQAADAPLTQAGEAAAIALAERLAALGVDAIYSSPYRRAVATVAPYACIAGAPILEDTRLRERVLSQTPLDDWLDHLRRSYDDDTYCLPTGESLAQAQARGLAALADIDAAGQPCLRSPATAI